MKLKLGLLLAELDRTLALIGVRSVDELDRDILYHPQGGTEGEV